MSRGLQILLFLNNRSIAHFCGVRDGRGGVGGRRGESENQSFFSLFNTKITAIVKKARIKIVPYAIYTYLFFSYIFTLPFCWNIKSCCNRYFPQQIRPQITVGFNMISKRHTLPIMHHVSLNVLSFDPYCFTRIKQRMFKFTLQLSQTESILPSLILFTGEINCQYHFTNSCNLS